VVALEPHIAPDRELADFPQSTIEKAAVPITGPGEEHDPRGRGHGDKVQARIGARFRVSAAYEAHPKQMVA